MSVSKRTKAAPVGAAASHNPFDSSDDESVPSSVRAPYPNPFDDDVGHLPHEARKPSTNPFDDEPKRHGFAHQPASTNPFDDEELPKRAAVTSNPRRTSKVASSHRNNKDLRYGSSPSIGSTNPFDDEGIPSKSASGRHKSSNKESQSPFEKQANNSVNLKAHNSASLSSDPKGYQSKGEEDYKYEAKAVKADPSSKSPHASVKEKLSSISDGVANSAHRLKQGTIGQFIKDANASAVNMNDSGKPKKSGLGGSNSRDLLLEGAHNDHGKQQRHQAGMQGASRYEQTHMGSSGLEGQNVQELENYALHEAEETTSTIYNCLKIAEDTKDVAIKTTIQLHEQGEQIQRTHDTAVEVDLELSKGEKLLGSLGGLFSKTWKPKKTRNISGPSIRSDSFKRKTYGLEQRAALGLTPGNVRGKNHHSSADQSQSQAQILIEAEKSKQDDTLSDLSNVLGQLKDMTLDMGKVIERQNEDLDNLHNDVTELGFRVKGANERGRRLLGR